jgi:uncharacterized membrane protein (DUF485 family)
MGQDTPPTEEELEAAVDFRQVQQSEQFKTLRKRHRSFVIPMAVAFLLWYFLYVLLADYAHDFMSTPVFGNINVGLILGLLQIATTFGITMWYVSYANKRLDPVASDIRRDLEQITEQTTEENK